MNIPFRLKKNLTLSVTVLCACVIGAASVNAYMQKFKSRTSQPSAIKNIASKPSPTVTSTPAPTLIPFTPTPTPKSLTRIGIAVFDFSKARVTDRILDINVRLYTKDGVFIAENKPNAYVQDGPVGTGGNAEFDIPYGSYRAEAEKDSKKGSVEFTIDSPKDDIGYTIYLKAGALKISGRLFLDKNKNTQFDEGEKLFPEKQVRAIVDTEGKLYTAYETKTDSNGRFEMYPAIFGKYLITTEQIESYHASPEYWIDLSGAQSVTRDVYVWE